MSITRRDFLLTAGAAAAVATVPRPLLVHFGRTPEPVPPIEDPRIKELAAKALEAAVAAGAIYADVRLTHDWIRSIGPAGAGDGERITVGVRALFDGYWGFASSPVWSPDEMARLGQQAVHQARVIALGKRREVELAPVSAVRDGRWVMPIKIDPFQIHPFEIQDTLRGLQIFAGRTPGARPGDVRCDLFKQEKAFGSTAGSYCTQCLYRTGGDFPISLIKDGKEGKGGLDTLSPAGVGWELFTDQPLREQIRRKLAEIEEELKLPIKPVEVGRYDAVCDVASVSNLLVGTLGRATELDRALGYEANAGGTSYINAPLEMLGTYQTGAPLLTVTANRAEPGGCATVQWDDEGVVPDEFKLVNEGILTDFQTTRESAGWLKGWYTQHGRPFRSHGCANSTSADFAPLQHLPNMVIAPGKEAVDFDGLVSGLTDGIAIKGLTPDMDFQNLNGLGIGAVYEVKRGKRVARLSAAGILFRAPELWKGLQALGSAASARRYGVESAKGEPGQSTFHSVTAVPAVFKQLTLIDYLRKA